MELPSKNVGGVAFITGAAGVIGNTVARRLSKDGWKIAGLDLRRSSVGLALQVDVTDQAAMVGAVAETNRRLGPISLLVTAAGIFESASMGDILRSLATIARCLVGWNLQRLCSSSAADD